MTVPLRVLGLMALSAGEFEDLAIGQEAVAEDGVGEVLNGFVAVDGEGGGGGGGLAQDHEDGLHADRAVGDVGGGDDRRGRAGSRTRLSWG